MSMGYGDEPRPENDYNALGTAIMPYPLLVKTRNWKIGRNNPIFYYFMLGGQF
jgi:hypothetical protein